jgi:hypothetical protein
MITMLPVGVPDVPPSTVVIAIDVPGLTFVGAERVRVVGVAPAVLVTTFAGEETLAA